MDADFETFWAFSGRVYRLGDVASTCLRLQDCHGADVNLVLFACWYGSRHGRLGRDLLQQVEAVSAPWRENTVRPLRQIRRWLKPAEGAREQALRGEIKRLELQAEQLQQDMLERLATGVAPATPAAAAPTTEEVREAMEANLRAYLTRLPQAGLAGGGAVDEKDVRLLVESALGVR